MSVKLVSHTCGIAETAGMWVGDQIAYCARVSNPGNQMNVTTAKNLLKYLAKNKHYSPFEMVSVCMEITTTRDISRQILRHRSFTFQEFSQRYACVDDVGVECIPRECRMQDPLNRQNSIAISEEGDAGQRAIAAEFLKRQLAVISLCKETYDWALSCGIAKEVARCVLPEGLTATKLYMNGSVRSWIHYINLRAGNGTQREHSAVATQCAEVLSKLLDTDLTKF